MSVLSELMEVTKLAPKQAEIPQSFLARLTKKAGDTFATQEKADAKARGVEPDDGQSVAWGSLSEDAQAWFNEAMKALVAKKDIESVDGLDEVLAAAMEDTKVSTKKKGAAAPKKATVVAPEKAKKGAAVPKKGVATKGKATNGAGTGRGRKSIAFPPDAKIKVLAKENPHRAGTLNHKRFSMYKSGMTVQEAVNAGGGASLANIRYLSGLGHLKVG